MYLLLIWCVSNAVTLVSVNAFMGKIQTSYRLTCVIRGKTLNAHQSFPVLCKSLTSLIAIIDLTNADALTFYSLKFSNN